MDWPKIRSAVNTNIYPKKADLVANGLDAVKLLILGDPNPVDCGVFNPVSSFLVLGVGAPPHAVSTALVLRSNGGGFRIPDRLALDVEFKRRGRDAPCRNGDL